jgi:hypothetical protein
LFSVVAYVVKILSPLDAHVCLSWWVVFSPIACYTACLIFERIVLTPDDDTKCKVQQDATI